jgi:DNA-binding NarL/FixJ family response regulator
MKKIKVMVVGDQMLFTKCLCLVLETQAEDIAAVGVAFNKETALQLAEMKRPDVVLLNLQMSKLDGIEVTRALKKRFPQIKVLILTTSADDEYVVKALHFGVAGYLLKDVSPLIIILAVRNVYQGRIILTPQVTSKLINRLFQINYTSLSNYSQTDVPVWLKLLNNQEKEILCLLVQGYDNKEIATRLYLAEQTIKNYVSAIYSKMGVHCRVQAFHLAAKAGLK